MCALLSFCRCDVRTFNDRNPELVRFTFKVIAADPSFKTRHSLSLGKQSINEGNNHLKIALWYLWIQRKGEFYFANLLAEIDNSSLAHFLNNTSPLRFYHRHRQLGNSCAVNNTTFSADLFVAFLESNRNRNEVIFLSHCTVLLFTFPINTLQQLIRKLDS